MGSTGIVDDLIIFLVIYGLQHSGFDFCIRDGMLDDFADVVFVQPDIGAIAVAAIDGLDRSGIFMTLSILTV